MYYVVMSKCEEELSEKEHDIRKKELRKASQILIVKMAYISLPA